MEDVTIGVVLGDSITAGWGNKALYECEGQTGVIIPGSGMVIRIGH